MIIEVKFYFIKIFEKIKVLKKKFEVGVNEIQHVQCSRAEIAEEQAKDEVRSEVISWVEQGKVLEKAETKGKASVVLVACSMFGRLVWYLILESSLELAVS